ncbi:hypothetical protein Z951_46460 [Streptomyces sp. PRh5]|nr:hypothetical protein Z951_46460 [Streptomyces sp. PRh5]
MLSELDEYAVEQALQIAEGQRQEVDDDVEVTVLTAGPWAPAGQGVEYVRTAAVQSQPPQVAVALGL